MGSETDLRHAISMKPSPFNLHRDDPSSSGPSAAAPTPPPAADRIFSTPQPPPPAHSPGSGATSTAYEASPTKAGDQDPIARHIARLDGAGSDVEGQSLPTYTRENDPYFLASRLKTDQEIETLRADSAARRGSGGLLGSKREAWRARKVKGFYERQNENITRLLKPVDDHRREAKEEQGGEHLRFKIAVNGSFIANIILAGLQLYAAIASGSLSLFTTMADALFDPLSNLTLILCNRAVNRVDGRKFPSGKARIETAGNIFFCFLMCAVSFIIIVMSCRDLAAGSEEETKDFHLSSVIAVAVAFATKFSLFLYCFALRNKYSQIRILWEDHRNDLLINGFGILTSVGGSKLKWFIDPIGAIVLSLLIVFLWMRTAYSEFQLLIGVSADTDMLQLITYISMTHSPDILAIDTVRAYHSGPRLIVEVDVVMDPVESLRFTHDVAEELQTKLESLPNVERAYVHVDYETSHAPEHFLKKEL